MKQKGRKLAHYVVVGSSLLLSGAMQPPLIIGSVRLGTRSNTAKPLLLLKMALNELCQREIPCRRLVGYKMIHYSLAHQIDAVKYKRKCSFLFLFYRSFP